MMDFPIFRLERSQTLYENDVRLNLTESGVHPRSLADILTPEEQAEILRTPLGYGYTDGRPKLRNAIADWYPGARPENVLVANGSSEANLLALTALLSPGDELIVIVPNFLQLDGLARALGIAVVNVALSGQTGWQPDLAAIAAAITPQTKAISICDPNNPTGVLMTPDRRAGLAKLAADHGLWLHVDEIYRGAEIDGGPSPTSWGLGPKVIVSGGVSKSFALPGLRLGWLIAPPDLVARCHERQDYTTIGTGTLSQIAAETVLRPAVRERVLAESRAILQRGRQTVTDWVAARNDWTMTRPDSGGMVFLGYAAPLPSTELVTRLREAESTFVCAGEWFGLEGHIRIGIGVEHDHLVQGLAAIDRTMAAV
jgi:aspartate/methionine/tyrosine aminotransferase